MAFLRHPTDRKVITGAAALAVLLIAMYWQSPDYGEANPQLADVPEEHAPLPPG